MGTYNHFATVMRVQFQWNRLNYIRLLFDSHFNIFKLKPFPKQTHKPLNLAQIIFARNVSQISGM